MATLRFGTFLAAQTRPVYEVIAIEVGRALGVETDLVALDSYDQYLDDSNDIAFICSLPYVAFAQTGATPALPIAAPVLMGKRYGARPIYFSDVVVQVDSDIVSFEDLRGCTWAYNDQLSQSGYGVVRHHLLQIGETSRYFGSVVESGSHEESMRMVIDRQVDGAAIDSHLLAIAVSQRPKLQRELRVVASLGPSSIQPIVASRRIAPDVRDKIVDVLTGLHDNPAAAGPLADAMVDRLVPVGPATYDDVREMMQRCAAAGFLEIP